MQTDCRGLEFTAKGPDAMAAFDATIDGYLGLAADTGPRLKAVFEADPDMPMAHVLKGYFFMLMASAPLKARAAKASAEAEARMGAATSRERRHASALAAWVGGRHGEAVRAWEAILAEYPRDVLALRLSHHGYFYKGDSANLRAGVERALPAWDAGVPGFGFVKGMHAFGLEETGAYDAAVAAGKDALALQAKDPWAIHAVAHVHEMTGRAKDGLDWIAANESGWKGCNNFRYHVWWHRALMHLARGDTAAVLALYDRDLWDETSDEYLDLCNDAALLLRLELHGIDVGDRWLALGEKCRSRTNDRMLAFVDAHFVLALSAAGRPEAAEMLDGLAVYAETDEDNATVTRAVGLDLARSLAAYKEGAYARTVDLLVPIMKDLVRVGGSHAQRDLFSMVLLDAALRAGRTDLARALADQRLSRKPGDAWTVARRAQAGAA